LIDGFRNGALIAYEGNFREMDYFLDCSIAEYYTRLKDRKVYVEWHNAQFEKTKK